METHPREVIVKKKFPNTRKPAHQQDFGEFWNFRGQHNQERKKKKNPQITCLTTIPSGEVAQMLAICHQQAWAEQEGAGSIA